MSGFEAYGFILAMVMTDPITTAAMGRVWARFLGIRRRQDTPPFGSFQGIGAAEEQASKFDKSVSVQKASAGAGKAQTNETA